MVKKTMEHVTLKSYEKLPSNYYFGKQFVVNERTKVKEELTYDSGGRGTGRKKGVEKGTVNKNLNFGVIFFFCAGNYRLNTKKKKVKKLMEAV